MMLRYFKNRKKWNHYLALVMGCNMARRVGDILDLRWSDIYNPINGKFRQEVVIREQKTHKLTNPRINSSVRNAVVLYIEKTRAKPSDNYESYIFSQNYGAYRGKVLSESGHLKAIKKASLHLGISYNVGTHSARKFFGMMSRRLHPADYNSMELLQTIYNHNDSKTTSRYIGITKERIDKYYDDIGAFFDKYIVGDGEYEKISDKLFVTLESKDLRMIISECYKAGRTNSNVHDISTHLETLGKLMDMAEGMLK